MKAVEKILRKYADASGRCPFDTWFNSLKDKRAQAIIDARLTRLRQGNFGKCRSVGDGVMELKIHHGPGYRVYFGREGEKIVILLCGGDKSTQSKDIEKAKIYWSEYKEN